MHNYIHSTTKICWDRIKSPVEIIAAANNRNFEHLITDLFLLKIIIKEKGGPLCSRRNNNYFYHNNSFWKVGLHPS